ncbi:hypothetical protein TIFTF001_002228 [Ficus carica]|uniref:Uncharacterized protein n=1 Tax=Ficus carica TaxID=3494 RepID=A0AA87Z3D4_FICCA|nr:hypothetical protein TIFTF001_002228 [Ficus carica]
MHHLAVKSDLFDSELESNKLIVSGGNDRPLCPKPRRLGPSIPDFLKPLPCSNHSERNTDPRSGILNVIADKNVEGRECVCLPACYSGSPPGRTDNPLVHDVQFVQYQMELHLLPLMPSKLLR